MRLLLAIILSASIASADQFAVVYSQKTGRIRRIVVSDDDRNLANIRIVPGESINLYDKKEYKLLQDIQKKLNEKTGKDLKAEDDTYAVVDKDSDEVKAVIVADPDIDKLDSKYTLIKSTTAEVGKGCKSEQDCNSLTVKKAKQ